MALKLNPKYYTWSMQQLNECNKILNEHKNFKSNTMLKFKAFKLSAYHLSTGLRLTARGTALLATLVFETIARRYKKNLYRQRATLQVSRDTHHLDPQKTQDMEAHFRSFIENEGLFKTKSDRKKETYIKRAVATYASSKEQYGSVVNDWVLSILETANSGTPPKRVVFLARDGIAPYEAAKVLKSKYPGLFGDVNLSLLYLSRKVIDWSKQSLQNRQMLIDYARQEGLGDNEQCLFIDIGFFGSMIDTIKETLSAITPQENIEFGFLVSHTPKAHGFMADMNTHLSSVRAGGQNPAVYWLEDTHQGVGNSATRLERDSDGRICPFVKNAQGSDTCKETQEKSFLYKAAGMKAVIDAADELIVEPRRMEEITRNPSKWRKADEQVRKVFDGFLEHYIKGKRISFSKHF